MFALQLNVVEALELSSKTSLVRAQSEGIVRFRDGKSDLQFPFLGAPEASAR